MNFKEKYRILIAIINWKLRKKPTPLVILWTITTRCNSRCSYCACWKESAAEPALDEIKNIIDQLACAGTLRISLTGGEPLLREDIGEIITYIKSKHIFVSLNSNGILISEKINLIKNTDLIQLSLDGPKLVHDSIRNTESYDSVIESAEILSGSGIKFSFNATISGQSIDDIEHIIKIADKYATYVNFQPVCTLPYAPDAITANNITADHIKTVFDYLRGKKRKKPHLILNSLTALSYMSKWPEADNKKCWAGILYFLIGIDCSIFRCAIHENKEFSKKCSDHGLNAAIQGIQGSNCQSFCCSSALEMNYILSCKPEAVLNAFRIDI